MRTQTVETLLYSGPAALESSLATFVRMDANQHPKIDRERPGAEPQRKKGQPSVLCRGAKRQWLHVTVWRREEKFPAHLPSPLGIKELRRRSLNTKKGTKVMSLAQN